MTEGNSYFHGGKPLVSDTLASALWGADYLLQIAQAGYIGANLHAGGNGLYTPIAGDTSGGFTARPVYYGMLLAQRFAGSTFVQVNLSSQTETQNVTAFAAESASGAWKLAIFKKAAVDQTGKLSGVTAAKELSVELLQAPAIDSHTGVTFAGSPVGSAGQFYPKTQAKVKMTHGTGSLHLPAYTAAYLEG